MESKGAVTMFKRYIAFNQLRYKTYVGDGDTSSYKAVVDSKPFADMDPKKDECIGHVQKRVGSRLHRLKKTCKEKLSDGKPMGGKGRLTDKIINELQNSMGMAIRQNIGNLYAMKKSVAALLYHDAEGSLEERPKFCPRTVDSWCKYQADIAQRGWKGDI